MATEALKMINKITNNQDVTRNKHNFPTRAYMNLSDIVITDDFINHPPKEHKINKCREFYKQNHCIDKDIIIDKNNTLVDGYIRYLVLLENGVKSSEVKISYATRRPDPKIVYVFAKHRRGKKEYAWKVTKYTRNADELDVGKNIVVNSEGKRRTVTVTKIESSIYPPVKTKVKKVYKVLPCKEE
jgi:hypothetical protein